MKFRVYALEYKSLMDVWPEESEGFVITAGGPREARRIAHRHRATSERQAENNHWLNSSVTRIRAIGTSSRKSPRVHLISRVSA
jgi:hypothetical protein